MSLRNSFVQWLFPGVCILCSAKAHRKIDLCEACECELPWLPDACRCCAQPIFSQQSLNSLCGNCVIHPPPFASTLALFAYRDPIIKLIAGLKFHKKLIYARVLGELLAARFKQVNADALPECIIPVPLHAQRLRERGYNQALEMARPISKQLKIPLNIHCCVRTRATQAQVTLPADERHLNVKNAFAVAEPLAVKHVAVIDDVMTTGHTLAELCQALHKSGVEQIDVWCAARTIL